MATHKKILKKFNWPKRSCIVVVVVYLPTMAGTGEDEDSLSFSSPEEEMEYWKEKALEYRAR